MSRSGRASRAWRGIAAAAVATFFATVSHAAADGTFPSWWGVVLALALAAPVCVLFAARGFSWWRVSAAIVISQALFHAILSLDLSGSAAASSGHVHALAVASEIATGDSHTGAAPGMWMAHVVAAICTVLVWGRGERAARALWELVRSPFRLVLVPISARPVAAAPAVAVRPIPPSRRLAVLSVMRRRGPPVTA
ncbi:hypothetical protein [Microbacterium rhizomatis]|uniref:MFS transporter n=1 Tax=Microbacterium rhizomatis TaxID=1631477 RepID=A0A5J5J2D3_9MICO|nr:hypothetical protein [Microbacterium rhizomatis]KAA9107510.1 hypothetical protein F6B43_08525 [Microbacterium rhizomatis]